MNTNMTYAFHEFGEYVSNKFDDAMYVVGSAMRAVGNRLQQWGGQLERYMEREPDALAMNELPFTTTETDRVDHSEYWSARNKYTYDLNNPEDRSKMWPHVPMCSDHFKFKTFDPENFNVNEMQEGVWYVPGPTTFEVSRESAETPETPDSPKPEDSHKPEEDVELPESSKSEEEVQVKKSYADDSWDTDDYKKAHW